jgi:hypothetical protein
LNGENPTLLEIYEKYKEKSSMASLLYQEYIRLRKHFLKIEEALGLKNGKYQEEGKEERHEEMNKLCSAIANGYRILNTQTSRNVHAEMQLLALLIQKHPEIKEKEIYMGISKLCCLHCRSVMDIFNSLDRKTDELPVISRRGKHDCAFDDNWIPPDIILNGYYNKNELEKKTEKKKKIKKKHTKEKTSEEFLDETSEEIPEKIKKIGSDVGKKARKFIDVMLGKPSEKVSMNQDDSPSEPEKLVEEKMSSHKAFLEKSLLFMESISSSLSSPILDENSQEIIKLTSIAIEIHKTKMFVNLCKEEDLEYIPEDTFSRDINAILTEIRLNKSKPYYGEISFDYLIKLLKNSDLFGTAFSKNFQASKYFSSKREKTTYALSTS